jgi:hypothetical protein
VHLISLQEHADIRYLRCVLAKYSINTHYDGHASLLQKHTGRTKEMTAQIVGTLRPMLRLCVALLRMHCSYTVVLDRLDEQVGIIASSVFLNSLLVVSCAYVVIFNLNADKICRINCTVTVTLKKLKSVSVPLCLLAN